MNIAETMRALKPDAVYGEDYTVADYQDGRGPVLEWHAAEPEPTREELEAAWPEALREHKRLEIHRGADADLERIAPRWKREKHARDLGRGRRPSNQKEVDDQDAIAGRAEQLETYIDEPERTVAELEAVSW